MINTMVYIKKINILCIEWKHGLDEKIHGLNEKIYGSNEKLFGLNGLDKNAMVQMTYSKVLRYIYKTLRFN